MKTRVIIFLLMMLMALSAIYASEDPTENEVYVRKTRELKALEQRFKEETGFSGNITYRYEDTKLSQFRGKFSDTNVSAPQDTTFMGNVFDAILTKMMPYIYAKGDQLTKTSIKSSARQITRFYEQTVNGYSISGGSQLSIAYNPELDKFTITDSTKDISNDPIPIIISKEMASHVLIKEYQQSAVYDKDKARYKQGPFISYASMSDEGHAQPYRLYWSMSFWDVSFYVDVQNGEIYHRENPAFSAEYQRKSRELKALSERFKADTGFVGIIDYNYNEMRLQSFDGVFSDIKIVAAEDTLALRPAFDTILTKLLPFSMAPRDQLVKSSIGRKGSAYATDYVQIANGYKVEGAGFISIRYFPETKKFSIGNSAVDIPQEPIGIIISEEAAFTIARTAFEQTGLCNEFTPIHRSRTVLLYKSRQLNGQYLPYKLYWRVSFPSISYYVDVETSEFFSERYVINDQQTYTVNKSID
ncbi:MAG: hypothetical protein CVU50_05935 [Candidatus Cloacimonetes bacterium HGW-Cloacimonetes-3]|jgi:hypothetical protein|nr:MAG: hypothetical protein CVU50_05935 [Candidatus Cloacimonetes bacterium HGW-Cloacimonetes-3]